MTRIDPFAGEYHEDGESDTFIYNDMSFAGRWRRWFYRTFWRHWPW